MYVFPEIAKTWQKIHQNLAFQQLTFQKFLTLGLEKNIHFTVYVFDSGASISGLEP